MATLSKNDILNSKDSKTKTVAVPEWGGDVIVSVMSGFARDKFESDNIGKNGGINLVNIRARLAAASLIDEHGKLLFDEQDIIKLGNKSSAALQRVFNAAQELNLMSDEDVEELAGNS